MIHSEKGIVSLFTTVLLSMLLLVITVSLVSLEVVQLRKSEDSEQTLRAYYAAEAGVEDAVSQVLSGAITETNSQVTAHNCITDTGAAFDTTGLAGWTCKRVSFSGSPTGKLDTPDQAKTVDTFNAVSQPTYNSIVVEWNQTTNPAPGFYNANLLGGAFPTGAGYNSAPPLEVAMLEYPTGGFGSTNICLDGVNNPAGCTVKLKNMVIVPAGGAASGVSFAAATGHGPWAGNCGPLPRTVNIGASTLTGYNCYAVITGFNSGMSHLLRLRSRYGPSAYRLTFQQGGSPVDVNDGTVTIDVTAKAGDTYRRVVSKLPLTNLASSGLNYVIYSDSDICKNFSVIDEIKKPGCF